MSLSVKAVIAKQSEARPNEFIGAGNLQKLINYN